MEPSLLLGRPKDRTRTAEPYGFLPSSRRGETAQFTHALWVETVRHHKEVPQNWEMLPPKEKSPILAYCVLGTMRLRKTQTLSVREPVAGLFLTRILWWALGSVYTMETGKSHKPGLLSAENWLNVYHTHCKPSL